MSGLVRCYNGAKMTDENNNERLVAQEMVRLSEARLDVQQAEINALERKATLLGTFCVAVIGYLLASDAEWLWKMATGEHCRSLTAVVMLVVAKMFPSMILVVGVVFCWKTLFPWKFRWKGVTLVDMAVNPFEHDLVGILKGLAKRYDEAFQGNGAIIQKKKERNLSRAIVWSRWGMALSFVSVMLAKIAVFFIADC